MKDSKRRIPNSQNFDYAKFEKEAIQQLMEGKDLVGSDGIMKEIIQRIVHAALEGEIEHHLKTKKDSPTENDLSINRRNGSTSKNLKTSLGEIPIATPRDRNGTFDPILVKKWDRNLNSGLDNQIIELYSKGNSVEDIRDFIKQMYGPELSAGQITAITDKVWDEVLEWKKRVLKPFYVLIYLDAIYFRIRENGKVVTKAIYTVYGVDANGERDILDLHIGISEAEGAKEWGRLLEKIKDRGVEDVLFFAVDGLSGFSEAILQVFPKSIVQRCIVHMIRTSVKFIAEKDRRAVCQDLKLIYTSDDEQAGWHALEKFAQKWDGKYPEISKKWINKWEELTAFFGFNTAIRRLIYTTNAVEGLHRMMRKVTKTKGAFTNEKALLKLLFLNLIRPTKDKSKKWKKKIFHWTQIHRGLEREFGERFTKHVDNDIIIN